MRLNKAEITAQKQWYLVLNDVYEKYNFKRKIHKLEDEID